MRANSNSKIGFKRFYKALTAVFVAVWLVNGFYCKIMGMVPRHEQIVGRVLGEEYASVLTLLIGISELLMAAWLASGFLRRMSALAQIILVLTMNIIEFAFASDLLLWGRLNAAFAAFFAGLVAFNAFYLYPRTLDSSV